MFRMKTFACALFLTGALAASGLATSAGQQRGKSRRAGRGSAVYTANCARCHGPDGRGQTRMGEISEAPDLSHPAYLRGLSNARLIASVTNGRGQMPAFRRKLSRQDIAAAVAHVRTLRR